ncbi:flagellar biosynthesis protein FlhF [Brevibacillus massiliensis]|uniref:flagellar biosynthesis protein FlhF n=1 Tax=Brevibacillus massiliensis TaxID=1118054 RepID=UPI0002D4609B|nr:flagellar biosynthesis protein FlhF [Brevibacillus massiliensis]
MRVKRYVVDSMPDALEQIKVDFGKDAIILGTKPVKTRGFLGFFGKEKIEVIAAVDPKQNDQRQQNGAVRSAPSAAAMPAAAARQAYGRGGTSVADPPRVQTPVQTGRKQEPGAAKPQSEELVSELRQMRSFFQKMLFQEEASSTLPPAFLAVRNRLLNQEVEREIVSELLTRLLGQFSDPVSASRAEVFARATELLKQMLDNSMARSRTIPRSVKYAFFFGPTGVGKTTTIAKLAAEAMLKERRRVGFITSDTYRIAAVEQLKTYANILNAPLEVVFTPEEIDAAKDRLGACDLILVDTAGRNYRNEEFVREIKALLRRGEQCEHYLTLSLAAKYEDTKAIIENFSDVPVSKVIFTKSDETSTYGSIVNVACRFHLSLSYITTGQNVPDDIVEATSEVVANFILGDDADA